MKEQFSSSGENVNPDGLRVNTKCDSSSVYASAGDRQDAGSCPRIFASDLAAPSVASARNKRSIRKKPPSGAECIGRTTAGSSAASEMCR